MSARISFKSDREKWECLREAWREDAREPPIRFVAETLWEAADADPEAFAKLAQAYARDVIRYQTDVARVGREDIATPGHLSELLRPTRRVDDCDGKARLFVALCRAVGLTADMVPRWDGERLAHVSAVVWVGSFRPVELTLARARLGEVETDVPKEHDGKWMQ